MSKYPPLYATPPQKKAPTRWYLRPLFSRGEYSPRLTMAWLVVLFALWLTRRWVTTPAQVVNGILIQPASVAELVGLFLGFAGLLLGLGTFQKVRLDGPPPAPETQVVADTAPVSGENVTVNPQP